MDVASDADVSPAVAASGVVVFCAVVREHRELAFHVNVRGTFNAIRAAVAAGHDRFINSGPGETADEPTICSRVRVSDILCLKQSESGSTQV